MVSPLPPDPDTIKYPIGDTPTLILSVSDTTLTLGQQLGAPVDLYVEKFQVEQDEETLNRNSSSPVRFGLFTGQFTTAARENSNARWTLSVSGAPGDSDVSSAATSNTQATPSPANIDNKVTKPSQVPPVGPNGCPGGTIEFYAEEVEVQDVETIFFKASGGPGYRPKSPDTGSGGNGGDGGQIRVVLSHYPVAAAIAQARKLKKDSNNLYRRWPTDFKASTKTLIDLVPARTDIRSINDLSSTLVDLQNALGGSLLQFQDAVDDTLAGLRRVSKYFESLFHQSVAADPGNPGRGSKGNNNNKPDGKDGGHGKPGQCLIQTTSSPQKVWESDICFVHPLQCRMLLNKAKAYFFADKDETLAKSQKILERLSCRLEFLDHVPKTGLESTKLAKAYRAAETRLYLPVTPPNEPPGAFETLLSIKDEARATLSILISGKDFYGQDRFYAPRLSFLRYKDIVTESLQYLKQIEEAYTSYQTAANEAVAKQNHIRKGIEACRSAKSHNDQFYGDAVNQLWQYDWKIRSSAEPIRTARDEVNRLVKVVHDEIMNVFQVSFHDIVGAMGQILMVHGKGMVGLQGVNLLEQANTTIPDDNDNRVNKTYLIHRVENIKGTLDSLLEGYKVGNNGKIDLDDPGATKLQISQRDLNKLLDSYWNALGSPTLSAVKKAFQDYITLVLDRNTAVLGYNVTLGLMAKYKAENRTLAATIESLGQLQLTDLDLHSPLMAVVMKEMYVGMTMTTQHWLYKAQRAYNFIALDSEDIIGRALGNAPVSQYNYTLLLTAQANLANAYYDFLDKAGKVPEGFTLKFPLDKTYIQSIKDSGRNGKLLTVRISIPGSKGSNNPADDDDDDDDDDDSGPSSLSKGNEAKMFTGMSNIRLTNVRFFLKDAETTLGKLRVTLTHMGTETFMTVNGRNIMFTHDMVVTEFQYEIASKVYDPHDMSGSIGQDSGNGKNEYALVGPFTTWQIHISPEHNDGLNLSNVSEGYMEFKGEYHSIP